LRADTPELRSATLELLARLQPVGPHKLLTTLRKEYGVSHRAANETVFRMMHEGAIRRTFFGKLKLP
jgi:hypothetical protein